MKKSIGLRLTVIMLIVIFIGIAVTATITTVMASNIITDESIHRVDVETQAESHQMDRWLESHGSNVDILAEVFAGMEGLRLDALVAYSEQELMQVSTGEPAPFEDLIGALMNSVTHDHEEYFETYMGFPNGQATAGSGYKFDYSGGWATYKRGWYQLALTDTSKAHITSPYIDTQTGQMCITAVRAVTRGGEILGVVGADIFLTELENMVFGATLGADGGYSMLLDSNGDILVHANAEYAPDSSGNFKNLSTVSNGAFSDLWRQIQTADGVYEYTDDKGVSKYYTSVVLGTTGWRLVSVLPTNAVLSAVTGLVVTVVIIAVVILALASVLIFLIVRRTVTEPLAPLTSFMEKAGVTGNFTLSGGEKSAFDKLSQQPDELGRCINGAAKFVSRINEVERALTRVAEGDLTAEIDLLSADDTMGDSLKKMIENLNGMFAEINASTAQVSLGSTQVADGAQALAQGATEQAATVEKLSSQIADVSQKTKENAEMAGRAAEFANTIKKSAEKGSSQMDDMMVAVKEISQASQNIGNVIKAIDDIAFQTNILALNAAVEAARAGQHGKGFAVVAEEVRNLAAKSSVAAKDTEGLIANSIQKAELGERIANDTAASLEEIVSGISESNQIVSEIARSSDEQSQGISEINNGIEQVVHVIQQNSATAEQSAAASQEMSSQANVLEDLINRFKIKEAGGMKGLNARGGGSTGQAQPQLKAPTDGNFGKY